MENQPPKSNDFTSLEWNIVRVFVLLFALLPLGGELMIGGALLALGTVMQELLIPALMVAVFAQWLLIAGLIFQRKFLRRLGLGLLAAAILFGGGVIFHRYWTKGRFATLDPHPYELWDDYRPFHGAKTVSVTPEERFRLTGDPRIDGAYALYPVYAGVVQSLYPPGDYRHVNTHGSDVTFRLLNEHAVDMIFSGPPSRAQAEEAAKREMTYEITPFAREAFVFFVHADNPVRNLTSEQVRAIYGGRITDWRELGAPESTRIIAFQRNEGSGSQTMLQKIMEGTPIVPPPEEERLAGMGGIIRDVANYRNYPGALGFSFRFFATEMFREGQIRLLAIDGIEPTLENIASGRYPFLADCCVITAAPRSESTKKIVDFLFSPAGRELVRKVGYTPIDDPR